MQITIILQVIKKYRKRLCQIHPVSQISIKFQYHLAIIHKLKPIELRSI